jgi:hypothetical protein
VKVRFEAEAEHLSRPAITGSSACADDDNRGAAVVPMKWMNADLADLSAVMPAKAGIQ